MKANTAICLMVAAGSLYLLRRESVAGLGRRLGQIFAIVVATVGVVTLAEHVLQFDVGMDQFLFHESQSQAGQSFPGRMGVAASVNFCLLGMALLFLDCKAFGRHWAATFTLAASAMTFLVFLYYFYGIEEFEPIARYATIALHTVLAFACLCSGILLARPGRGFMPFLLGQSAGSLVARRMLPPAIILPILLGWLRTLGRNARLFGMGFGTAAFVVLIIVLFAALIWWTVAALDRLELKRKQAEQSLKLERELLETIVNFIPASVALVRGSDLRFELVNPSYQAIAPGKQMVGKTIDQVWPESMPLVGDRCRRVLATGDPFTVVDEFHQVSRSANGALEDVYFSWSMNRVKLPGDAVPGLLITVWETTERKRTEIALRDSEKRFRDLADNIAPLAWMADPDGNVLFYNQRWYDYTGTTFLEMQGSGWKKVHHPEHLERVIEKWTSSLQHGQPWEDIFPLRRKDGPYGWFLSRAFPIRDAQGNITRWFGTNMDITELRETQEALNAAQAKLLQHAAELEEMVEERTARLRDTVQELESFSYSIAHDMRAPLRAMQGFANIIAEDYSGQLPEQGKLYLARIRSAASRLDLLIQDVLNYSRVVRGELPMASVNTELLLKDIIESYPNLRVQGATIDMVSPLPIVEANAAALTQVFSNLLGNGVKFVKPGTQPRLKIWAESAHDPVARLWFQDNGIGVEKTSRERIFQMFQRLNRPELYEGTGMGLAIARKAVERMGGNIGVESEPDHGSRFWVELKRSSEQKGEGHE
jgi:PAS domain S-box-containing protein